MHERKNRQLKPLVAFDASVVQPPLNGFLTNVSRELEKNFKASVEARNSIAERHRSLLLIMLRVAINSYETVCFLVNSAEKDPKKLSRFALVLPPINRQMMDTLFSLVYMMDDFVERSLQYEVAGYRQLREIRDRYNIRYALDPDWHPHLENLSDLQETMEHYLPITPEQKQDPFKRIRRWPPPSRLIKRPTASKAFLEHLHTWLYDDTSAQAHMNAAGLGQLGGFVIAGLASDHTRRLIEDRTILQYTYLHFTRTLITVLAIATEIDHHLGLNNREAASRTWGLMSGFIVEAKDLYEARYRTILEKIT